LAGTDIEAHRDFTRAAERQRRLVIRVMNEDLMRRGPSAGRELWERIPNFTYHPPPLSQAIRHVTWDVVVLILWTAAALWMAWYAVVRRRAD